MAWTTIPNSVLETGKPARALDMRSLRDNPIAIAQGEADAPRIELSALNRINAGDSIRVRKDPVAVYSQGLSVQYLPATSTVDSNSEPANPFIPWFRSMQAGRIRLNFEYRRVSSGTLSARLLRRRAGTNQFSVVISMTSSTFTDGVLEVDVIPGDLVLLQMQLSSANTDYEIRNIRWCVADGEHLWPSYSLFGKIEGNPTLLLP